MKKECALCNKKLGFVSFKHEIKDGYVICQDCVDALGFTGSVKFILALPNVPLSELQSALNGDTEALYETLGAEVLEDTEQAKVNAKQANHDTKEDEKMQAFMEKYNLDSLNKSDLAVLQRIAADLVGNSFFKAGMALSFAKAEEQAKVTYLSALVEQNWIIINQLGRLNDNIEKLANKEIQG